MNLRNYTAIADPSTRQRGSPTWKKKVIVTQRNVKFGHLLQRGPDTKMNWPIDRWSQYNLILILILSVGGKGTQCPGYKWATLFLGGYKHGDVSTERVVYCYGSYGTRTSEWLQCILQIRPLDREGVLYEWGSNWQTIETLKSGHWPRRGAQY
jgi:hypothetical protein